LNCAPSTERQLELLGEIRRFISKADGLQTEERDAGQIRILQKADHRFLDIDPANLEEVLFRSDTEGRAFLQINFCTSKKILVTESVIGFKPIPVVDLAASRLPRVVTTLDIASVVDVIQDALHAQDSIDKDVRLLRQVLEAVIAGGESVGFNLREERLWVARLVYTTTTSA
jgi:hypothetical protein